MELVHAYAYSLFSDFLTKTIDLKASRLIISVPGAGVSYFSDYFINQNSNISITRITSRQEELSDINILELDFYSNPLALHEAEDLIKRGKTDKRFFLVMNNPSFVTTEKYKSSFVAHRLYNTHYFSILDKDAADTFAHFINPSLADQQVEKIYSLSGGHARLIKFFAINPELINENVDILYQQPQLAAILNVLTKVLNGTDHETLQKLGLLENNDFKSQLLKDYDNTHIDQMDIDLFSDLSFAENGVKSINKLIKVERDMLTHLVNETIITREQIADFKWGEGSYDRFSDQAINKTVQRLNKKLSHYQLEAIPQVGYKLVAKSEALGGGE